ncbi:DUF523 domain-containing protein [Sulfurimonas sp.]|uniref:DUF523 domain-containing protein n=1 Tax=Sulfurimonas sp. TaxID=2022749 RepID=UPI002AB01325|nr:DUF523 domain-containing protein [Sulfurimonas sp.]
MSKKKVIISACLLGHLCRYDGRTKGIDAIVKKFKDYEIIPFCPEAQVFGTPREKISVVKLDAKHRIITDNTNKDVTQLLKDEINSFIKLYPDADAIVLKSKSPSCGYATTPIMNKEKEVVNLGNGIAAEIFLKEYTTIKIKDELNY